MKTINKFVPYLLIFLFSTWNGSSFGLQAAPKNQTPKCTVSDISTSKLTQCGNPERALMVKTEIPLSSVDLKITLNEQGVFVACKGEVNCITTRYYERKNLANFCSEKSSDSTATYIDSVVGIKAVDGRDLLAKLEKQKSNCINQTSSASNESQDLGTANQSHGLTWSEVTKAEFELGATVLGLDSEKLVEIMKSVVWSGPIRRDYKTVLKVERPDNTKLICVSIGENQRQYTIFVADAATNKAWTSNFCRHK